jgi:hypothetical protein
MREKNNIPRLIGFVGLLVGFAGTIIGNYADHKDLEQVVEKKLNERLNNNEDEEA